MATDAEIEAAFAALTPAQRSHISKMNAAVLVACIEEFHEEGRKRLAADGSAPERPDHCDPLVLPSPGQR